MDQVLRDTVTSVKLSGDGRINQNHNLLICDEKRELLSGVDICVTLTNMFSPSRKRSRKTNGAQPECTAQAGDSRGMVLIAKGVTFS